MSRTCSRTSLHNVGELWTIMLSPLGPTTMLFYYLGVHAASEPRDKLQTIKRDAVQRQLLPMPDTRSGNTIVRLSYTRR